MNDSVIQQATMLVKGATYKLIEDLSKTKKCYVSDLYNYILTGYNPDERFTNTRTELLTQLCSIVKQIITDGLPEDSDITEEKIEQSAVGFTNQFINIYLNEKVTFPIHQWEGATPVIEDGCILIHESYDTDMIEWLRKVGYNVLLKKY